MGGKRVLRADGFDSHIELAASLLDEIPKSMAAVGDIAVLTADDGSDAMGVVNGERIFVLRPDGILGSVSLLEAKRAFRV